MVEKLQRSGANSLCSWFKKVLATYIVYLTYGILGFILEFINMIVTFKLVWPTYTEHGITTISLLSGAKKSIKGWLVFDKCQII